MRAVALLAAGVLLAGCASTPGLHLDEGKAIAAAWTALDAASKALDPMVKAGATSKAQNALIAAETPKVIAALDAATTAYRAGDNAGAATNVAAATTLIVELAQIAGAH